LYFVVYFNETSRKLRKGEKMLGSGVVTRERGTYINIRPTFV